MQSELNVLVVDDEPGILDIVGFVVESLGHRVITAASAEEARHHLAEIQVDMAIIDVMLPDESGISLCRTVAGTFGVPVILLTALGETPDRIAGLEAGASDYVGKPFNPKELSLRVAALARMTTRSTRVGKLVFKELEIDTRALTAHLGSQLIDLSPPQFRVLAAMMQQPTEVLPYAELLVHGWGSSDVLGGRELLKATIYRIRMKLTAAAKGTIGVRITNIRGVGYALTTDDGTDIE